MSAYCSSTCYARIVFKNKPLILPTAAVKSLVKGFMAIGALKLAMPYHKLMVNFYTVREHATKSIRSYPNECKKVIVRSGCMVGK